MNTAAKAPIPATLTEDALLSSVDGGASVVVAPGGATVVAAAVEPGATVVAISPLVGGIITLSIT